MLVILWYFFAIDRSMPPKKYTQRRQLLETKCGWNANSTLPSGLTSWGLAGSKLGSKVKGPVSLGYLYLSTLREDLIWGTNSQLRQKISFPQINLQILLPVFQLFALTRPSSFQLDWQPLHPQWVLSFAGECQGKSHCVRSVRIGSFLVLIFAHFDWISLRISPYLFQMRENTDQKNVEYRYLSRSINLPVKTAHY